MHFGILDLILTQKKTQVENPMKSVPSLRFSEQIVPMLIARF